LSAFLSVLKGLGNGLLDLITLPWIIWQWAGIETLKERMIAFTMAGKSVEFLYMMLSLVIVLLVLGICSRRFLKTTVLSLESFNRCIGQFAAWFVLLLMLQQVLIIVMGQVFKGNELLFSPFGMELSNSELQWLSGQLKFYNAILIAFASAYTFIEGGHVRVDLVYGNLGYRAKRLVDFFGSIFFMLPTTILLWWFAWPLAMNAMFAQRPMNIFSTKASWRGVKLESSGTAEFTWIWAFKLLILVFAALLFIQAIAFMLRNLWALLAKDEQIESHPTDPDPDGSYDSEPESSNTSNRVEADSADVSVSQMTAQSAAVDLSYASSQTAVNTGTVINAQDRFAVVSTVSSVTERLSVTMTKSRINDSHRARTFLLGQNRRSLMKNKLSLASEGASDKQTGV